MRNRYYFRSHLSERRFRALVKLFSLDIPALTAAQMLGVRRQTTQRIYSRLRARLILEACRDSQPFTGEVEIDESYFGPERVRGKKGRAAAKKIVVIGLLKRGGRVYTTEVEDCSKRSLQPIIRRQVLAESTVYTDGWASYDGLIAGGYRHYRIHHQRDEFARGRRHINGIESFWSFAKTRLHKLRGIRKHRFWFHLKESEWRWNHRRENLYRLLLSSLRKLPLK